MKRTFPENKRFVSRSLLVWKKKSNIMESTSGDPRGQDTEEVLINFLEEELDYMLMTQRWKYREFTFLAMKQRDSKPGEDLRPILA